MHSVKICFFRQDYWMYFKLLSYFRPTQRREDVVSGTHLSQYVFTSVFLTSRGDRVGSAFRCINMSPEGEEQNWLDL
jgi:hypothetical protein